MTGRDAAAGPVTAAPAAAGSVAAAPDRFDALWAIDLRMRSALSVVNGRVVGRRYVVTSFLFLLVGGLEALLLRIQLARPESTFLDPYTYNQLFTMHGVTMLFLFAVPILEGIASYLVPMMIGTRDLAFPRMNAFGYWCYLFGGLFLYSSFLVGAAPDGGWYAYVPLTGAEYSPGVNMDFYLLGVTFVEISALVAATEIIVAILLQRAPGMTLRRMPVFVWTSLVMALMVVFGFPPLILGALLLEVERAFGLPFYRPGAGGDPLLWQHLFWIFGHPEVYIIFLPAAGMVSMIAPVFCRRPLVGYAFVVWATVATAILSFGLWAHHMFSTGLPHLALGFFSGASIAVAIPSGIQVFAWLATLWTGRPRLETPLLFVVAFLVLFTMGGVTGVMVAVLPYDLQVTDTYFVVAHFHYVLVGGMVTPLFAALHYWTPKVTGRMLSEPLGWVAVALLFVGLNLAFFPMHHAGLAGMPRRVFTYAPGLGLEWSNLLSTIGALVFAAAPLVYLVNLATSVRRGRPAGRNPWDANTLEWATASPPEPFLFRTIPVVKSADPLWDKEAPDAAAIMRDLGVTAADRHSRVVLGTSPLEAEPEQIVRLAGPSYMPLALSLAIGLGMLGMLIKAYWLLPVAVAACAVILVVWNWPDGETAA